MTARPHAGPVCILVMCISATFYGSAVVFEFYCMSADQIH